MEIIGFPDMNLSGFSMHRQWNKHKLLFKFIFRFYSDLYTYVLMMTCKERMLLLIVSLLVLLNKP